MTGSLTPVDLKAVLLTALLYPAVIVVAFWMGRGADQWQKLPVAAFAAALLGLGIVYIAARVGMLSVNDVGPLAENGVINPGARVVQDAMPMTTIDETVARNNVPSQTRAPLRGGRASRAVDRIVHLPPDGEAPTR